MVLAGLLALGPAAPVPAPGSTPPGALCTVTSSRLAELSGMVVHDGEVWASADGGRRVELHRLDRETCAIAQTRTAAVDPYDVEDLAVGPDGATWVGDIGDNERARATVAVIVVPARGEPRVVRLAYPDGPHDAEALLVDGAGRPVIVTKELGRPAGVYRTDEPPSGSDPNRLRLVGTFAPPASDTRGGPIGGFGTRTVTGGATTADRSVAAVRTYTDAWLVPVPDGDVATALVGTAPVRVPLPGEPQGEAIAFTTDGTLLSGSEARSGTKGQLRAVPSAVALLDRVGPVQALEPMPPWLPAAIGAGVVVAVLGVVTVALAVRGRRRG